MSLVATVICRKLEVTTITLVMRQHFPQEILKQLDMDYGPSYMALIVQDLAPKEMKQVTTLNEFKAIIKILELTLCRQGSLHNTF